MGGTVRARGLGREPAAGKREPRLLILTHLCKRLATDTHGTDYPRLHPRHRGIRKFKLLAPQISCPWPLTNYTQLPMSFIASFFALDLDIFPRDPVTGEKSWPIGEVSGYLCTSTRLPFPSGFSTDTPCATPSRLLGPHLYPAHPPRPLRQQAHLRPQNAVQSHSGGHQRAPNRPRQQPGPHMDQPRRPRLRRRTHLRQRPRHPPRRL